jgi:sialidase-1
MKQVWLEHFDEGGYKTYRGPCIIATQKGTVIAGYESRRAAANDWASMDITIRRSTDGGATWSERIVVGDSRENCTLHNPVLFADGEIVHMLYNKNYHEVYYTRSTDDGLTWSKPRDISTVYETLRPQCNWTIVANGPCHGIVTSGGRLLVPLWIAANKYDTKAHHPAVISTLYSDDRGETWHCGEIIWNTAEYYDMNEAVLAETCDGRFLINCRHVTQNGMRLLGYSPDGIQGWHDMHFEPQLKEPICAAGMAYDKTRIWFTNCDNGPDMRRIDLTLQRSDDAGKTWHKLRLLDPWGGYSDAFYDANADKLYVIAETGRSIPGDEFSFGLSVFILEGDEI